MADHRHRAGRGAIPPGQSPPVFEVMEPRLHLDGNPIITEFVADNKTSHLDSLGVAYDWIEISNPSAEAVSLLGWHLTDSPGDLEQWTFPDVTLDGGAYLIVFASSLDRRDPNAELHTNFGLSKGGDYLALVGPGGEAADIVSEFDFGPQEEDISYGVYEELEITALAPGGSTAYTLIPDHDIGLAWTQTVYDTSGWMSGPDLRTGVGYETSLAGFAVRNYLANVGLANLDIAEGVLVTPSQQIGSFAENALWVDYFNTGGRGHYYEEDLTFPGLQIDVDANNFVIEATGTLLIPQAGSYTFGVNSDDGFRLTITGATTTDVTNSSTPLGGDSISFYDPRGPGDTLGVFSFAAPGAYEVRLVMYENGGGSACELWAAPGSFTGWNATDFRRVGDVEAGGLEVRSQPVGGEGGSALYGPLIETDVEEAMYGQNASAYVRVPFNVADPGAYTSLALRMMYDDGFVAYLNGVEVARRNAPPGTPGWNAQAAGTHVGSPATSYEDIDITAHLGLLQAGTNVLAIHGLNAAADDEAFLILPELAQIASLGLTPHYFATPTPGWANSGAFVAYVADTEFSVDRGFYDAPFDLEITSDTPLATLYYTTDGTLPGPGNGTVYTAPIPILTTSVIRAVAVRDGWEPSNADTQTYIFLGDVLQQTRPDDYPTVWGPAAADYDMDADVINNPAYHDTILDDLRSLPTMSIVMDWQDIFGPMGIYSNSWAEGVTWERACSVEYIEIDGTSGFQENAGIRIYGGVSRDASVKQHTLRLLFKAEYGATKLDYPLFEGSQVERFDTFILRGNFNDGWGPMSFGGNSSFIRDQWARDVQIAMGQPAMDGTYVHLYINGLYWGLYNPVERADASFLAEHLGGEKEDYDAINSGEAIDGDMTAWNTLIRIANTGHADAGWAYDPNALASADAYALVRQYCDVDNLIDYILLNFYSGNGDWDGHNWYAGRKREAGAGFKFFSWDHEWALSGLYDDATGRNTDGCPTRIFQQLRANAEFRLLVADHIQRHYFGGGPLTPEGSAALWQARVDQIYDAMVGESARWGDMVNEPPLTRDGNWLPVQEWFLDSYFPNRSAIAFQQLVNMNLYPRLAGQIFAAPEFNWDGGTVPYGFDVTITAPQGTIYYTLDGTDPRVAGGAVAPGALVYGGAIDLTRNTLIKCRAYSGGTWSALAEATFVLDNAPDLRVTEIMYHPAPPTTAEAALGFTDEDAFEFLELRNVGDTVMDLGGFRFGAGIDFAFPAMTLAPGAYALVVADQEAFEARYGTGLSSLIVGEFAAGRLANDGERLSLEAAVGGLIHDFKYNDTWYDHTDGAGFSLVVRDDTADLALWGSKDTWRASASAGGSPGAADVGYDPGSVIVSEILAHTDGLDGDWIELYNAGDEAVPIGGWFLSDSPDALASYRIAPGTVLEAGEYLVLTQAANFGVGAADPGCLIGFGFSELGETAYLTSADPSGAPGGYREVRPFGASDREVAFGLYTKSTGGTDFVAMVTATPWGPNDVPAVGPVVINEIMYHPETGGYEFIELLNLTGADVPLYDDEPTPNPWKFTDGVDFTFPAGAYVPAWGYALVVGVTEAEFRAAYPGLPADVPVFGPYTGLLDNAGETIELSKPGIPEPITGFVPYVRAERVTYGDSYPWPVEPDGQGAALNRWVATDYGNDPANWATSTYGGTPGAENVGVDTTPPSVPTDLQATALSASEIQLTWTASVDPQTAVSGYRVYRDGIPIAAVTGTVYVDTNASTARTYAYQVSALNLDDIESPRSEPPLEIRILAIGGVSTPSTTTVSVRFTETVTRASAELKSNYTLTAGGGTIAVTGAVLQPNNTTVLLTVDTVMDEGIEYTLAVENVVALTGIEILPGSQIVFGYYVAGSGTILREYWLGIGGGAVSDLTGNVNYPDNPTGTDELNIFETPGNGSWNDNYGTRLRGYLHPPITGEYTFWISSDDGSELWLSTDEDPGNKVRIAYVPGWTGVRQWNVFSEQQSAPITLQVGRRYYVEALHKEGGGGDNLAVKWKMPDATEEAPIPGLRLSPYIVTDKPTVDLQVVDADAAEAGRDPGTFWITRTGDTAEPLTVHYTVGGTATSDDYEETLTGVVVIGAGEDHAVLTVTPLSDSDPEEPDETVVLTLTAGEYRIGTGSGAVTIANNPVTNATVSILQIDRNAAEPGADRGTLWIMRVVGDTAEPLTVYYAVSGTADPDDYQETLTGQVVIPAGLRYAVVTITPVDDAEVETDETVTLTLLPGAGYVTGVVAGTVTIHDNDVAAPPAVVTVELNGRAGRSTSAIEPGGIGVRTVTVTFSEAVVFDASAVVVRKVTFDGETEVPGDLVTPASVAGSGSAAMTLTFDAGAALDTWVKIILKGDGSLATPGGLALDGEPCATGTGYGYIYSSAVDLPTGDGTAGGDAVFYVGSLRGDMRGAGFFNTLPDGVVDVWDINGFVSKYIVGDLDADMRGAGFFNTLPDGVVDVWDINGFVSFYQAAASAGTHLDPLPTTGPLAAGDPLPLALPTDAVPAALAATLDAAALATAPDDATLTPSAVATDDAATETAVGLAVSVDAAPAALWTPEADASDTAETAFAPDGALVDLLALPALDVPLGA